ncbi:AraC family transcriptional regulator [Streptomyces rhizosphaerihabitans]|uniref:AraC family transcriptional regulator n=1 Tax=Streptomyces rhizosphaerihabitans TaxID=1266770 RepID=UPI0021C0403A|nr:AraC family transcriptional regulator [Streptomyces rhizosphaerihabitans]MCT9003568.1 AraC family transcriptional regulator [Streptomyces rhizosphaerihabitans]
MEPLIRSAALTGFPELCHTLGLDPHALLRHAGLNAHVLADQDRWIPALAVAHVLELSADACGREDFGLRLAELRRLSNLGPVSLLVREEPNIRGVLQVLIRYERMYNEALRASLHEADTIATLHIALELPGARRIRQAVELVVGAYHQVLSEFLGHRLRRQVCFTHAAPANLETHHRVLGTDLAFRTGFNGIVLAARTLEATNTEADPILRRYAQQYVESLAHTSDPSDTERVRKIIEVLLPTGRCTANEVARSMGIDRRTVQRRLAQSGETFSSLRNATRHDLAQRFVANDRRPLTEVAQLLGFTSPGAFSRWFRDQFGISPSQWRGVGQGPSAS